MFQLKNQQKEMNCVVKVLEVLPCADTEGIHNLCSIFSLLIIYLIPLWVKMSWEPETFPLTQAAKIAKYHPPKSLVDFHWNGEKKE